MYEKILEKYPNAKIQVYVVWFSMLSGDSRSKWPQDVFKNDPRVLEFWDAKGLLGDWYGNNMPLFQNVGRMWDMYALYGPESRWQSEPSHLVSWARPVISGIDRLSSDVAAMLKPN